jgi:hypothetical protein
MILGTCQRNRPVDNIIKIHKAWSFQTMPYSIFAYIDFNPQSSSLSLDRLFHLQLEYEGINNSSYMINRGIRSLTATEEQYIQLIGDDCYPAHPDYFKVCLDLIKDYDIIMPKLIRSDPGFIVPEFNTIYDKDYINFIKSAKPEWQIYYNEGAIFAKLKVFETLRGYDETYIGWGYEDKDLIARAEQYGYKIKRLDPPYHLVHSYHPRLMMYSKEADINRRIYNLTLQKKLPLIRMDEDWGLNKSPNVNYKLRKELENRIKI